MVRKIKVKNSGIIKLTSLGDSSTGKLTFGEAKKNIPFEIKRVYYINDILGKKTTRGHHAHKKLDQVIFCVNGSFVLNLDDGKNKQKILMNDPSCGVRLGPSLWHTMEKFSLNCVILVLASDYYDEKDYLRDYNDFKNFLKNK
jgi:dTDP-4-dehydrorhamnose 3,5-epimerase-like enzyme